MVFGIILAVVAFIAGFFSFYEDAFDFFDFAWEVIKHAFATFLFFFIGCFISVFIGLFVPKHWEETNYELVSLRDDDGINGVFFLGTGYIDSEQNYMWYQKDGKGCRPGHTKVDDDVLICEDSTLINTGSLVIREYKMNWTAVKDWLIYDATLKSSQYIITIPAGSLKKDFKLK